MFKRTVDKLVGEALLAREESFVVDEFLLQKNPQNCLLYLVDTNSEALNGWMADVLLVRNHKVLRVWRAKISYIGWKGAGNETAAFLKNDKSIPSPLNFNSDIVTILHGRESYRELIEIVGESLAKKLLLKANDASALHAFRPAGILHKKITKDISLYGLISSDSDFYTYISLKLIFSERLPGASRPISELHARLLTSLSEGSNSRLDLVFGFDHSSDPLALPVNVIIGANGVGKTRALDAIAKSTLRVGNSKIARSNVAVGNPVVVFSHEPKRWGKYRGNSLKHISLSVMGGEWKKLPAVTQQIAMLKNREFSLKVLNKILRKVVDTSHFGLELVGSSDFVSLDKLSYDPSLCEKINLSEGFRYVDDLGLEHSLSSGQRAMICFCFNLAMYCEPRSLLLIDEPENHLHPRFISLLMQTLHSILLATESVAVVATHSPFVVREVDRSGVMILQADELGRPFLYRPGMQTLGGDVSLISDHVFEDLSVRKGYQESIDQALLSCRNDGERKEKLAQFAALGFDAAAYARSVEDLI